MVQHLLSSQIIKKQTGTALLRENQKTIRSLLFVGFLTIVFAGYHLSFWLVKAWTTSAVIYKTDFVIAALIIWGLILWNSRSCYLFRSKNYIAILKPISVASLQASGLYLVYLYFIRFPLEQQIQTALFFSIVFVCLNILQLSIKYVLQHLRTLGYNYQTVLIIGKGRQARRFADKITGNSSWGFQITGFLGSRDDDDQLDKAVLWSYSDIPQIGFIDELSVILKTRQVDWVVIAPEQSDTFDTEPMALQCQEMGVRLVVLPKIYPTAYTRIRPTEFFGSPVLVYETGPSGGRRILLKEAYDRIGALVGLISALPIIVFASISIKLFSKGPIFFIQERLGKNGKRFKMIKFRTMRVDAENIKARLDSLNEMDGPVFKIKNDPRVTAIGGILRKTSIDELPQLFNVLKGDMSLVGPRPPLPDEVKQYDPWQRRRLSIKPGITCLWQVEGRNKISFENWMRLDLEYIDNWSLWLDTKILARTIPAVLSRKGAS